MNAGTCNAVTSNTASAATLPINTGVTDNGRDMTASRDSVKSCTPIVKERSGDEDCDEEVTDEVELDLEKEPMVVF